MYQIRQRFAHWRDTPTIAAEEFRSHCIVGNAYVVYSTIIRSRNAWDWLYCRANRTYLGFHRPMLLRIVPFSDFLVLRESNISEKAGKEKVRKAV